MVSDQNAETKTVQTTFKMRDVIITVTHHAIQNRDDTNSYCTTVASSRANTILLTSETSHYKNDTLLDCARIGNKLIACKTLYTDVGMRLSIQVSDRSLEHWHEVAQIDETFPTFDNIKYRIYTCGNKVLIQIEDQFVDSYRYLTYIANTNDYNFITTNFFDQSFDAQHEHIIVNAFGTFFAIEGNSSYRMLTTIDTLEHQTELRNSIRSENERIPISPNTETYRWYETDVPEDIMWSIIFYHHDRLYLGGMDELTHQPKLYACQHIIRGLERWQSIDLNDCSAIIKVFDFGDNVMFILKDDEDHYRIKEFRNGEFVRDHTHIVEMLNTMNRSIQDIVSIMPNTDANHNGFAIEVVYNDTTFRFQH